MAKKMQMCGTETEMRDVAARICRNYMYGTWQHVDPSQLVFKRISGGLSNFLYYVALPDDVSKINYSHVESVEDDIAKYYEPKVRSGSSILEEPKKVLIRIYGQVHGERAMDAIVTESVIFTLLSERKLGPKLHGVFSGGRIEEYIPARPLITKELSEPALSMKIAEKMAAIHSMNVPLSKEPTWLWDTLKKWMKTVTYERLTEDSNSENEHENEIIQRLKDVEYEKEIDWLRKFVLTVDSLCVFCHNDMQEGNILLLEEDNETIRTPSYDDLLQFDMKTGEYQHLVIEDSNTNDSISSNISDIGEPKLFLIDFEYCAYNYRGFDIANHFNEWVYDYTNTEYPFYHEFTENSATLEQKEIFIKEYLKHFYANSDAQATKTSIDAVNHLLHEVEAFTLASHLFWSIWSIVNASKSQIPFGYWDYAQSRLDAYLRLKQDILKKEKLGIPQKRKICEVDI